MFNSQPHVFVLVVRKHDSSSATTIDLPLDKASPIAQAPKTVSIVSTSEIGVQGQNEVVTCNSSSRPLRIV